MARAGQFLARQGVGDPKSPWVATLVVGGLATILCLQSSLVTVVTFTAVLLIVLYSLIAISSLVSRIRQRDAERPSKMPIWPVPPIIALVGCGLAITQQKGSDLLSCSASLSPALSISMHSSGHIAIGTGFTTRHRRVDHPAGPEESRWLSSPVLRSIVPRPDQYAWTFGGVNPVWRVRPGEVIRLYTEDCFAGNIRGIERLAEQVHRISVHQPADRAVLCRGSRARGHARNPSHRRAAGTGLGGEHYGVAVRVVDRHEIHRDPPAPSARAYLALSRRHRRPRK